MKIKPLRYILGRPIYPDIKGAQVAFHGRLGEVTDIYTSQNGFTVLKVKHFNSEPWDIAPCITEVEVLERTWPDNGLD